MKSLRSKAAQATLGIILLGSLGVLAYDNYKAHEQVIELQVEAETYQYLMGEYMIQYARCAKYVEIMHETCKCETKR